MSKSRKELRREAALRELERRAQSIEQENLSNVETVNWGTAKFLNESIRLNILRLGGTPVSPTSGDAIVVLAQQINWPSGSFRSSENRYRNQYGDEMNDLEIQDSVWPWCYDFRFCNGEFYSDWRDDFTACDSNYTPIGTDGHYYYFISRNESEPNNPLLFRVDHETVDEPPYNLDDASIGTLLKLLIAT